jgi:hypothetical protein
MLGQLKKLLILVIAFLTVLLIIFVVNQTNQVVSFSANLHPLLGQIVLYALLIIYAAVIILPIVAIFQRPVAMFPPEDLESEAYRTYLKRLAARLAKNPNLKETATPVSADDLPSIEAALKQLDSQADENIKAAASTVFIMTAISQYGALDAVIVTLAQLRMIWQVTMLYNQRPSLRDLAYLYGNVFATAFLATKIENLDLLEDQLEPVIASVMGSSLSSLTPGFNAAAVVITNSIIQGSANAFLTIRVGIITRKYCSSLVKPETSILRRTAAAQSTVLLAKVLGDSTYNVTKAIIRATAKAGTRPIRYGQNLVTKTTRKTWDAGKLTLRKTEDLARTLGGAVISGGKKIKFYFAKPESETETEE